MRSLYTALAILFFGMCLPLAAQTTFDELEFEPDSVRTPYKPSGKNYVLIRSKRGTSGVNKTASADAILNAEVSEIVLVFSETEAGDLAEREEANRERWENLLKTYPELFQFSTTYKNVCQCSLRGDAEAFKQSQGFYVYVNGDVPKVEEPQAVSTPAAATPVETPKTKAPEQKKAPVTAPITSNEVAVTDKTDVKIKEPQAAKQQAAPVTNAAPVTTEETPEPAAAPREPVKKKAASASNKPRRAKDAKACRPPCYGFGDEDLFAFFKDNIPLGKKKERRKAKGWMANVRLQINHDGSVKKAMVTGANEEFNLKVQEVLKGMNNWNAAVKGGVAVKSEVRFSLKYDAESKAMKPMEMVMNPRPSPKCTCVSDSEIFAD